MPAILPDFYQGDTLASLLTFDIDGEAIDITDSTLYFTLKEKASDTEAVVYNKITTFTAPAAGQHLFKLLPAVTAEIPVGSYLYDFRRVDKDGSVSTAKGRVNVLQPVTLELD